MKKKLLILTGGGDCPGLNAVIRGISKAARQHGGWEPWGSMEAFNGVMRDPVEIIKLTQKITAGIHVKGGTILKTTNKGNPLDFPYKKSDGTWGSKNISAELVKKIQDLGFNAVISIGGDGSQTISQELYEHGLNIIGVPKTIDNDLSGTDLTFGFTTAVQIATESFDRLVTTAESHHRVMIMEVMGRDAGWIALHTAVAGGAEICLIPEIPFSIENIIDKINKRYKKGKGFVNIVIAEGAKPIDGHVIGTKSNAIGDAHLKLGGIGNYLKQKLDETQSVAQIRTTILGHTQRGGTPVAFDRILATTMGVKAFEMVTAGEFGRMVSYHNNQLRSVTLKEATETYNTIPKNHYLIKTAKLMGISFGD